jgi:hypothetical protein
MVDSLSEVLDDSEDWDGDEPGDQLEEEILELQSATANATAVLDDAVDSLRTPRDDMESLEERVSAITEALDILPALKGEDSRALGY